MNFMNFKKTKVLFVILLSFLSSCATGALEKKKESYLSIKTEIDENIQDKLKNDKFVEVDGYFVGEKKFVFNDDKKNKPPVSYREYLVPNVLDGKDRVLQIFIRSEDPVQISPESIFKNDKMLVKAKDIIFYFIPHQRACEDPMRGSVRVKRWSDFKDRFITSKDTELDLENGKIGNYFKHFIVNEIILNDDFSRYRKVKFFISDDKNLSFIKYIIDSTNAFYLDGSKKDLVYFSPAVTRFEHEKFLSKEFGNSDDKVMLIVNDSDDISFKSRSLILAENHNHRWSCYLSQGVKERVSYVKRSPNGVEKIEMLKFPSLIYDLVTGPIQIPVLLYQRNQKEQKAKEQSVFEKSISDEISYYNKAKK